jgi:solute carrier family 8 (sodium/calcium exchanger)
MLKEFYNKDDGKIYIVESPVWNATIANLTLMALGSSAPEILLSIIEAVGTLGEPAGPLGASTIVGSAAFNLLVISAVSIVAVDKPKKI